MPSNNFQVVANAVPTQPDQLITDGDLALAAQQTTYFRLTQSFVENVTVVINGRNITSKVQKQLLALSQQNPMTVAQAQIYFSDANTNPRNAGSYTGYPVAGWGVGIVDWLATYNAMQTYMQDYYGL